MGGEARLFDDDFASRYAILDDGWRRHLASVIGLPADGLQLVHGLAGHSNCEKTLHRLSDSVMSDATVLRWTGAPRRSFSSAYARLLGALRPDTDGGLQGFLASDYPDWVRYRNSDRTSCSPTRLFAQWSQRLPPDRARAARRLFDNETAACNVHAARTCLAARDGHTPAFTPGGTLSWAPDFAATPEAARAGLFRVRDGRIAFDSDAVSPTCDAAEEGGAGRAAADGPPRILPGAVDGCCDPLERRALAGRITVEGTLAARAVIDAAPGAWYDPALVEHARAEGPGGPIWDRHAVTGRWKAYFGPTGWLAAPERRLVFLSGLDVTVTLEGPFSLTESAGLAPFVRRGIWPFTSADRLPDLVQQLQILPDGRAQLRLRQTADAAPLCLARFFPHRD